MKYDETNYQFLLIDNIFEKTFFYRINFFIKGFILS